MNFFEAISIFNKYLKINNRQLVGATSTTEDFKWAYRFLASKYHPDNWIQKSEEERSKAEEEMKEINNAYDVLCPKKSKNPSNDINLDFIKEEYINKIKSYNNSNPNNDTEKAHGEIATQILFYSVSINAAKTESEIENEFKKFQVKITSIYIKLMSEFLTKYLINKDEVTEYVCFGVDLETFYQWLLSIKKKYSPLTKIDEAVGVFKQYYACYFKLESIINSIIEKVIGDLKGGKITRDDAYSKVIGDIETCFKDFYAIKEKINRFKENGNLSFADIKAIEELELALQSIEDLNAIKSKINEIEDRILKDEKLKYQIPEMNRIYARVMEKASLSIRRLNPDGDKLIYKYINECILRIISIFNHVCNNVVEMEIVKRLDQITFSNVDFDNNILSFIEDNLSGRPVSHNNSGLYIRIRNFINSLVDISSIYLILSGENGIYKVAKWYGDCQIVFEEISEEDLAHDFVPLDNYLNDEHLVWKRYSTSGNSYYILYSFGENNTYSIALYYDFETKQWTFGIDCWRANSGALENIYSSALEDWKNPEYLKSQLRDYIRCQAEEFGEKKEKQKIKL